MVDREQRDELLERVMADFGPGLWRLTAGYARALADREDLFQDILLGVLGALSSFRNESSLRTFVYRIAHNQGISHRRRGTRSPIAVPLNELTSPSQSPEAEAIGWATRDRLMDAIRALPHGRRQVVMLSLEGFDHSEIGEILGLSANNVAVRLHRARADLRRTLEPNSDRQQP